MRKNQSVESFERHLLTLIDVITALSNQGFGVVVDPVTKLNVFLKALPLLLYQHVMLGSPTTY